MSGERDSPNPKSQQLDTRALNPDRALIDEKKTAAERALSLLPEELQKPISEFVNKQIDLKLAPAPVTRTELWVHVAMFGAFFLAWVLYYEARRRLTPVDEDIWWVLSYALFACGCIWFASSLASAFLRLQTQSFRITATFVALSFSAFGFVLVSHLSPVLYFHIRPNWLAGMVTLTFHLIVGFYWSLWFAKRAFPTTRTSLVKKIVGMGLTLVLGNAMIYFEAKDSLGQRDLPAAQVIPFASRAGTPLDLGPVLDGHFKRATAAAK